jgi:diguanylate cyclase (GGDEF)-like protein/PAS domain S-box-containing protein
MQPAGQGFCEGECHEADIEAVTEKDRWRDSTAEATAALLAAVIEHAGLGIALVGLDGIPFQANPAFERITGYSEDELLTMTFAEMTHPDDAPAEVALFQDLVEGGRDAYRLEKRYVRPGATWVWVALTVSAVRRPSGALLFVVALVEDVTERRRLQEEVQRQALHDHLTGLPNRRLFHDRLVHARMLASRGEHGLAVIVLDLNGFKTVNDSYGHAAGDQVLCAVAKTLSATCRSSDTVARLGGDEFAILSEGTDGAAHAAGLVERLRVALSTPVVLDDDTEVTVSASVGSASGDEHDNDGRLLLLADQRMYQDKPARHERL